MPPRPSSILSLCIHLLASSIGCPESLLLFSSIVHISSCNRDLLSPLLSLLPCSHLLCLECSAGAEVQERQDDHTLSVAQLPAERFFTHAELPVRGLILSHALFFLQFLSQFCSSNEATSRASPTKAHSAFATRVTRRSQSPGASSRAIVCCNVCAGLHVFQSFVAVVCVLWINLRLCAVDHFAFSRLQFSSHAGALRASVWFYVSSLSFLLHFGYSCQFGV